MSRRLGKMTITYQCLISKFRSHMQIIVSPFHNINSINGLFCVSDSVKHHENSIMIALKNTPVTSIFSSVRRDPDMSVFLFIFIHLTGVRCLVVSNMNSVETAIVHYRGLIVRLYRTCYRERLTKHELF